MTKATRALVLSIAVMAGLAACHSTVVRQTGSSGGGRIVSQPKYGQTVRVQRGDTLYGLAFRNGIDFRDLAAWNGIGSPYTIYPGQTLRLYPSSGSRPPASTGTASTGTAPRPTTPPATSTPKPPPPQAAPVNSGFSWRWPADGHVIGRFVTGELEFPTGGFRGAAWDDAADVEYTFYGLGVLALVAASR